MAKDADQEKVGYCNPPKSGQIKPGEIRNPWGRRGKNGGKRELGADAPAKTFKDEETDAILKEMRRLVTVNSNGKS